MAARRLARGALVGVITAGCQPWEPVSAPRANAGTTPARSSDDLPTPDGPLTTSSPGSATRSARWSSTRSTTAARPKNQRASSTP
ncbi:hypothetical protein CLV40_11115 [Actinokineospora auranticolor]|uniref:Uncharacterized protein n=1 Tax=Actinokineospora auranticolor TaxID=155976 RepID=A0A2S6GLM8_9PSEU|nr:hypothetical protein CLV40_11115 [Actinokineospora auranticolor]